MGEYQPISINWLLLMLSLWACGQRAGVVHHVHGEGARSCCGFVDDAVACSSQPPSLRRKFGAQKQVSCQDFVITIREGRHQFSWHKKQEQSRISPSDTVVMLTVTIPPAERDHRLSEKLRAEWPGILSWMIKGCLAWQSNGLQPPDVVKDATAS